MQIGGADEAKSVRERVAVSMVTKHSGMRGWGGGDRAEDRNARKDDGTQMRRRK